MRAKIVVITKRGLQSQFVDLEEALAYCKTDPDNVMYTMHHGQYVKVWPVVEMHPTEIKVKVE